MTGRIVVEDMSPSVAEGAHPAKAVVGEQVPVRATVWREGHDAVAATLVWSGPDGNQRRTRMTRVPGTGDEWTAVLTPECPGRWEYHVEGWGDPWATWRHAVDVKTAAGLEPAEIAVDLETGARLLTAASKLPGHAPDRHLLRTAAASLRRKDLLLRDRLRLARSAEVDGPMHDEPVRELVTGGPVRRLKVERRRALTGSWYELFPRSTGELDDTGAPVHGTFRTAAQALDRVAAMGFDVVYLPPIHPIGTVNRKGRNNSEVAEPGDPGSPWAIGSAEGGHDRIHPALGTPADFRAFVDRARELGMEIALDLALQCAPDHPWVREHPEWFGTRADGTIAFAENPPKKYEDIYPLDFDRDPDGLYAEVLRVVRYWIAEGVRIFRVDNPHTKPPDFWAWLIGTVQRDDPDVLFLAEAFTRPARLYGLARLGFSQSYTYFTWRTGKAELTEFGTGLVAHADECRPNLFVNTPDILHESLQKGGPGMFALRAALAATLSPTWGVYSGYELYECTPVREGSEEYLNSEKYELRPRDFAGALAQGRSLEPWITKLNAIRRDHPALRQLRTLEFHEADNDRLLAYSKSDPATGDVVLTVVTLDPREPAEGTVRWHLPALGLAPGTRFTVTDEVSGELYEWGERAYVKLDPQRAVAHILAVVRP